MFIFSSLGWCFQRLCNNEENNLKSIYCIRSNKRLNNLDFNLLASFKDIILTKNCQYFEILNNQREQLSMCYKALKEKIDIILLREFDKLVQEDKEYLEKNFKRFEKRENTDNELIEQYNRISIGYLEIVLKEYLDEEGEKNDKKEKDLNLLKVLKDELLKLISNPDWSDSAKLDSLVNQLFTKLKMLENISWNVHDKQNIRSLHGLRLRNEMKFTGALLDFDLLSQFNDFDNFKSYSSLYALLISSIPAIKTSISCLIRKIDFVNTTNPQFPCDTGETKFLSSIATYYRDFETIKLILKLIHEFILNWNYDETDHTALDGDDGKLKAYDFAYLLVQIGEHAKKLSQMLASCVILNQQDSNEKSLLKILKFLTSLRDRIKENEFHFYLLSLEHFYYL